MLRIISIISFAVTFAGIAFHHIIFPSTSARAIIMEHPYRPVNILRKWVYRLMLFCLAVLVITGFTPSLILGRSLWGYFLMTHVIVGPVFVVCLVILTLMWAGHNRFEEDDCRPLLRFIGADTAGKESPLKSSGLWYKIWFWLIVILALAVTLSIILSMLKFLGTTDVQELLLDVHRYCSLLLTLVIIVHTYLVLRRNGL